MLTRIEVVKHKYSLYTLNTKISVKIAKYTIYNIFTVVLPLF